MTDNPDQIRYDIERTRAELGSDVDALADKVRPSSIVQRRVDRMRSFSERTRDRVMGVARDTRDTIGEKASSAGETIAEAPRAAMRQAEGHPVAVGIIAFGVGLLASALIPASAKERELAGNLMEGMEPVKNELTDAARQVADGMKQPASEAADAMKQTASQAARDMKNEAADATQRAGGTTRGT